MSNKKVLIFGATGAMGTYLTEKLAATGVEIDAVSLDAMQSDLPNLHYMQVPNAKDPAFLNEITKNHYDAFVDFMTYGSIEFRKTYKQLLSCTDQYFYLSSCRVFANEETPITERSPRLLDVTTDPVLLASDDYCMYKARNEETLRHSGLKNWTIIRPSTTYSRRRCQLLTLERNNLLPYILSGKPVPLCEEARYIPASLTWGGDVADMIMGLMFKEEALCEDYNVTSSESRTWDEIAGYYKDIFGLNHVWVDELTYQKTRMPEFDPEKSFTAIWQLRYARLFNRVYDNTKMLNMTGLKQENFLSLYQGLLHEKDTILN